MPDNREYTIVSVKEWRSVLDKWRENNKGAICIPIIERNNQKYYLFDKGAADIIVSKSKFEQSVWRQ